MVVVESAVETTDDGADADRHPAVANPMSMRNDRLEIVLLRSDRP